MKKIVSLLVVFSILAMSLVAGAIELEECKEYNVDLESASQSVSLQGSASFSTANFAPGKNIFTGDNSVVTFEDAKWQNYFYAGATDFYNHGVKNYDATSGKVFYVSKRTDVNWSNLGWKYYDVGCNFSSAITRPTTLIFDEIKDGSNAGAFWYGHYGPNSYQGGIGATNTNHQNWITYKDTAKYGLTKFVLQYAMSGDAQASYKDGKNLYIDNVAIIPHYAITYHVSYPDGLDSEDVTEYYLAPNGVDDITVTNGVISGVATSYSINKPLTAQDYEFLGWTTEKGSSQVVTSVALNGKDVDLYPVWQRTASGYVFPEEYVAPGLNIFTGKDKAFTFDHLDAINFFTNDYAGDSKLFTIKISEDETKGKVLDVLFDKANFSGSGEAYYTLKASIEKEIKRPVVISFDEYNTSSLPRFLFFDNGVVATRNTTSAWKAECVRSNDSTDYIGINKFSMQGIGHATSCEHQYIDNLSIIPYYQITFKAVYPDETTGEDIIEYYLNGEATITSAADGTLSGLATEYPIGNTELEFMGYEFLGWSTEKNAEEIMDTVPLENKDIELYPVWRNNIEVYGENVFEETFDTLSVGAFTTPFEISSVSSNFTSFKDGFKLGGGASYEVSATPEENALKITGSNPELVVSAFDGSSSTSMGLDKIARYTAVCNFYIPEASADKFNSVTLEIKSENGKTVSASLSTENGANTGRVRLLVAQMPIEDIEYDAIESIRVYADNTGCVAGGEIYIDKISLYANTKAGVLYLNEAKTAKEVHFFAVGESLTFPTYAELKAYTPANKLPKGFEVYGKVYAPGTTIEFDSQSVGFEATAIYETPEFFEEYGNLVFYENFETQDVGKCGTYVPVTSFVNGTPLDGYTDFAIRTFAEISASIESANGNNYLKLLHVSGSYPQIQLWKNSGYLNLTKKGIYTLVVDASTESASAIGFTIRPMSPEKYTQVGGTTGANKTFTTGHAATIEISDVSGNTSLSNCLWYFGTGTLLLDNFALYAKTNVVTLELNNGTKIDGGFYAAGGKFTLPNVSTFFDKIPEGETFSHYEINGEKYNEGDIYTTTADQTSVTVDVITEKTTYYASFNLGDIAGTVADIPVVQGQTFVLPDVDNDNFSGWKLYGTTEVLTAGSNYTLNKNEVALDENNKFNFEAVTLQMDKKVDFKYAFTFDDTLFEGATNEELKYIKVAYGVGIIPKDTNFVSNNTVKVKQLIEYAVRMYNRAYGIKGNYDDLQSLTTYAKDKGICGDYADLEAAATYADFADIFANVLPDSNYQNTHSKNITSLTGLNANSAKLINTGIMDQDVILANNISYGDTVKYIASIVNPSFRTFNTTKALHVLGDSLCAGVGGNSMGWPNKLSLFVGDRIKVYNYGIGGINTESYFGGSATKYAEYLANVKPGDYVIIALGTNDATLLTWGDITKDSWRENYKKLAEDAYKAGAIPMFVVPVGRNSVNKETGIYEETAGDEQILIVMEECNKTYGLDVPIINFKSVTTELFKTMTAEERAKIYIDGVHYKEYGAEFVCEIFKDLILANEDSELYSFKKCFTEDTVDFTSEKDLYRFDTPVNKEYTSVRTSSPAGIRFISDITSKCRSIADDHVQYGFLIARGDVLNGTELTMNCGKQFIKAVNYDNVLSTDIIYTFDDAGENYSFACALYGMPDTAEGYKTELVVRSFVRVGNSYFYGTSSNDSVYKMVKRLSAEGQTNDYFEHVLEVCGE